MLTMLEQCPCFQAEQTCAGIQGHTPAEVALDYAEYVMPTAIIFDTLQA